MADYFAAATAGLVLRKLAAAAGGYAAALIAAHYLLPSGWLLYCAAGLIVLSLFTFIAKNDIRTRALLILLPAALGFFWYWAYSALFIAPGDRLTGETMSVTARVTDYVEVKDGYSVVSVRLAEEGIAHSKAVIYDYNGYMVMLEPGDIIEAELKFVSAATSRGEETDIYTSRGIFLRAYFLTEPEVTGRQSAAFIYFPKTLAKWAVDTVARVFPPDTAAFMKALLIGDKTGLYEDRELYNALGTAGILHVVAVSGMHLSFLWGFLLIITRSKRRAAIFGIPVVWIFAMMAGFTPSVVRAAFMLTLISLAPFLRREADGITSLSAILLILLIINPASAGSASLQLSFSAMAGIILLTPRVFSWCDEHLVKPQKTKGRLKDFIIASFSASVGAVVFSTPISALHFGYVSLVSPLTNMLVLWAVSICFLGGYFSIIAAAFIVPLGALGAWLTSCFARYIAVAASALAALPFSAVYTSNNLFGWWLAFTYFIFVYAYMKRRGYFRPAAPIALSASALAVFIILIALYYSSETIITALDIGQGQSIAVLDGKDTVLIDCGGEEWQNAGDTAADYLLGCGRTHVDLLVLTHLHEDHANGVINLIARVDVECIAMPEDLDSENELRESIVEAAEERGTEILYIFEDTDLSVGGISIRLYASPEVFDDDERSMIILCSIDGYDMLVTGDVDAAEERQLAKTALFPDMELYIAGHHGSRYSTSYELLEAIRAETAIISVGYNSYGHPANETLWRLSAFGMDIFRTDELGNVTIRTGHDG